MKILVEGSWYKNRTGIGRYSKNLFEALQALDSQNEYEAFPFGGMRKRLYLALMKRAGAPPMEVMLRKWPDVFLFTDFVKLPTLPATKTAVVVYDLAFLKCPQYVDPGTVKYLTKFVPESIASTDHVITISNTVKNEIVETYGTDPRKITVAYPGIDPKLFYPRSADEIAAVKRKHHLPDKYVLYTGTMEPRKNIVGILKAFSALGQSVHDEVGLVICGGRGWLDKEIRTALKALKGEGDNIHVILRVGDDDLPALYSGASAFVFPSFYEGFGMPPLEAMACGVPVVTSNFGALKEVCGPLAKWVDPTRTEEIRDALTDLLTGNLRPSVEALRTHAAQYSWSRSAATVNDSLSLL